MHRCPVSVVVLTKNEARLLERCLRSVAWADEHVVVDCGSTDGTQALAAQLGARVVEQSWLGWVPQRQCGAEAARHDWVFFIEADEIVDAELAAAVQAAIASGPNPQDGYAVDRRDEFFGQLFPNMKNRARRRAFIRLFNRRHSRYTATNIIHEEVEIKGRSIALPGVLLHWRSFTLAEQMGRYIGNADLEATQMAQAGARAGILKLLAWPMLRFAWCYLARGGWRLGEAGLVHAMMAAHSEFLRWATLWERQKVEHRADPPAHFLAGSRAVGGPTAAPGAADRTAHQT